MRHPLGSLSPPAAAIACAEGPALVRGAGVTKSDWRL